MRRLIDANALVERLKRVDAFFKGTANHKMMTINVGRIIDHIEAVPTVDAVEVVRCQDCIHAQPLDRNCEISTSLYMHCGLLRGEETKNVWHKYKKYYKDYSIVERDDYCSYGERIDNGSTQN